MAAWIAGKTFLVTGSTDGIGRHTALKLAKERAHVIVHGRNPKKVKDVEEEIRRLGGAEISSYVCDLASMSAVRQFAEELRKRHSSIDVLINNAGVFLEQKQMSVDGFETNWAVNVMAPHMLVCLLLDRVKSRIINLSSVAAAARIDFDNLQQEKGYSSHDAYSLSRLAAMLQTFSLAKKLKGVSPVTVNCLHPGAVNTKVMRSGWGSFGLSVSDADDLFYLATSPDVANISGEYFVQRRVALPPPVARLADVQERLWKTLEDQTGIKLDLSTLVKQA